MKRLLIYYTFKNCHVLKRQQLNYLYIDYLSIASVNNYWLSTRSNVYFYQGVAIIENVMDHLATALGMDPLEFRVKNLIETSPEIDNPLPEIIPQLRASSEYDQRKKEIEQFNQVFQFGSKRQN